MEGDDEESIDELLNEFCFNPNEEEEKYEDDRQVMFEDLY